MSDAAPDWRTAAANQTRLAFGQAMLEVSAREPRAVVLSSDTQDLLGLRPWIARHPARFVELGIAEQNTVGVAAGLATTGMRPYVCGYAPFLTARSLEQVRNDLSYARQRVVVAAAASGISLGVAGGTHHALEDLALMRSLPHMTVIVPADAESAWQATLATLDLDGPVYLRLGGRVEEPPVAAPGSAWTPGKARRLREGGDVTVIACGALVAMALQAADALAAEGLGVRVLDMHTVKPLDHEAVLAAAAETRGIVTAEEHHLTGGLGGAVAELLALEQPTRMRMVGMPDEYATIGPTPRLRARYGMSAEGIAAACRALLTNR